MLPTDTIQLKIPGATRSYTFIHISDAHMAYASPEDPLRVRELAAEQTRCWTHGDATPIEHFKEALHYAAEQHADAVMLTGDILDYAMQSNVGFLKKTLADCPAQPLYIYGNHEPCSEDPVAPDLGGSYPYYDSYADIMFSSPAIWTRDYGDFLIVGMDNISHTVTEGQLTELQAQFGRGLPVILLLHIPLYTEDILEPICEKWGPDSGDYFTFGGPADTSEARALCRLLQAPDCPVTAIFAGHIHTACESELSPGKSNIPPLPLLKVISEK